MSAVLVDTSVWIGHFRRSNAALVRRLERGEVLGHLFVIGELACGGLVNRAEILARLHDLPRAEAARHVEVLRFVDMHGLAGSGIGWIDAHLLAAARLSGAALWTGDRALAAVAADLGMAAE